jgi:hypothetical protein
MMNHAEQRPLPSGQSQLPERAGSDTFTPGEYASLLRLRWAIEAGFYDDDLRPGRAVDGQLNWAHQAAARPVVSAGDSPRRKPHVDGEIVIACVNIAAIIAAIAAAVLASGGV